MKCYETVRAKLADWRPTGPGPHSLTVRPDDTPWAVTIRADRVESLGCATLDITLQHTDGQGPNDLHAWGERLTSQVTGLIQPLVIHEVDTLRQEARLRSQDPVQEAQAIVYDELALKAGQQAVLKRFHAPTDPGSRREQTAFPQTYETLATVIAELIAAS